MAMPSAADGFGERSLGCGAAVGRVVVAERAVAARHAAAEHCGTA